MRYLPRTIAALLLAGGAGLVLSPSHPAAQDAGGWHMLYDNETLVGWTPVGNANWRLEGGAIVADDGNGFLVSNEKFNDFELRIEFWADSDTNSGIFIRCADPKKPTADDCYEVNIWDMRPEPKYGTGAIVNVAAVNPMPKAGGKWNVYEITAKGGKFTVILNGEKTVDNVENTKLAGGHIGLQHGKGTVDEKGVIKFRKVEIKRL
jgi:hypothetical protein